MLLLALGATLVGFALLITALVTGTLWLAVACIAICVIGIGFLVADIVGIGRPKSAQQVNLAEPEAVSDEPEWISDDLQPSHDSEGDTSESSGTSEHPDVPGNPDA